MVSYSRIFLFICSLVYVYPFILWLQIEHIKTFYSKRGHIYLRKNALALSSAYYGAGQDPIWLDEIRCNGTEASIFDCQHNNFGMHDCNHTEDVGINCNGSYILS